MPQTSNLDALVEMGISSGMRIVVFGILGVIGLLILGVVGFVAYAFMRDLKVPEDLATRPWIEHKFYTERLAIDVPWELKTKESPQNLASTDFRTDGHRQDELEVVTSVGRPSAIGDIDSAADEMVRLLKAKKNGTILKETRKEDQVLGTRALALYLVGQNQWLRKTDVRILFFKVDDRCYMVHCNTHAGDPTGDKIWDRMRKSIRIAKTAGAVSGKMEPSQRSWLPKGMERR